MRASSWNQISMGLRVARLPRWALSVAGKFYGMARPSFSVSATLLGTLRGEERTMSIAMLGIDLGKNSCSVAGLDETGRVILRRRLTRDSVVRLAAKLPAWVSDDQRLGRRFAWSHAA